MKKHMPKSVRKFVRREKARIRREVLDPKDQKEQILKLREKHGNNSNLQMNANDTNDTNTNENMSKDK